MPKYLAVDYLSQLLQIKRATLSSLLIAEPHHLEAIEDYVHQGQLPECVYRRPWEKASQNCVFEKPTLEELMVILADNPRHAQCMETYESDIVIYHNHDGQSCEVIQSSNPDSVFSLDEETIERICLEAESKVVSDIFKSEELESLPKSLMALEEVLDTSHLEGCLLKVPGPKDLMERLKPQIVQDPFKHEKNMHSVEKYEILVKEEKCSDTEILSSSSTSILPREHFEKEKIREFEAEKIEEPFELEFNQSQCGGDHKNEVSSVEMLKEDLSLKPFELKHSENIDIPSCMKELVDGLDPSLLYPENLVQEHFSELQPNHEMKIEPIHDKKKGLLESPMEYLPLSPVQMTAHQDLISIEMTPSPNMCLVSPNTKNNIEQDILMKDRVFDEILMMGFKEPHMEESNISTDNVKEALGLLELKPEQCSGNLELDLPWDPIADSAQIMYKCSRVDRLTNVTEYNLGKVCNHKGEVFSKCHLDQEPTLEEQLLPDLSSKIEDATRKSEKDFNKRNKQVCLGNVQLIKNTAEKITGCEIFQSQNMATSSKVLGNENTRNQQVSLESARIMKGTAGNVTGCEILHSQDADTNSKVSRKENATGNILQITDDPLDGFICMRFGNKEKVRPGRKRLASTCCYEEQPTGKSKLVTQTKSIESPLNIPPVNKKERKKKIKSDIIEVNMSEEFQKIFLWLKKHAESSLNLLHKKELIPANQTFESFNPDVTRFIMKQHGKTLQDSIEKVGAAQEVFEAVVILHCMVSVADVLKNGCLQTAISLLRVLEEKHRQHVVAGNFNNLRLQLFKCHSIHQKKKILHPKLSSVCQYISEWWKRKLKQNPDNDPKILIACKRDVNSLLQCIKEAVLLIEGVKPLVVEPRKQLTHSEILASINKANSLIVCTTQVGQDFPLTQFSLVVEYEYHESSSLKEQSERQSVRYLGLKINLLNKNFDDSKSNGNNMMVPPTVDKELVQFILIGSDSLINNTELLKVLETRYNITFIERNFTKMTKTTGMPYADIVLDEQACIMLYDFERNSKSESLVQRVIHLNQKYTTCWILCISYTDATAKGYPSERHFMTDIARIQGSLTEHQRESFAVKVLYSYSVEESGKLIRNIAEHACRMSKVWTKDNWVKRTWLSPEMSAHEQFLLCFPCFNPISAQILLDVAPLNYLMHLSLDQLKGECPWIRGNILQNFLTYIHYETVLYTSNFMQRNLTSTNCPKNTSIYSPLNVQQTSGIMLEPEPRERKMQYEGIQDFHSSRQSQNIDHSAMVSNQGTSPETDSNYVQTCSRDESHVVCPTSQVSGYEDNLSLSQKVRVAYMNTKPDSQDDMQAYSFPNEYEMAIINNNQDSVRASEDFQNTEHYGFGSLQAETQESTDLTSPYHSEDLEQSENLYSTIPSYHPALISSPMELIAANDRARENLINNSDCLHRYKRQNTQMMRIQKGAWQSRSELDRTFDACRTSPDIKSLEIPADQRDAELGHYRNYGGQDNLKLFSSYGHRPQASQTVGRSQNVLKKSTDYWDPPLKKSKVNNRRTLFSQASNNQGYFLADYNNETSPGDRTQEMNHTTSSLHHNASAKGTPSSRTSTPGIAPITPRIRKPVVNTDAHDHASFTEICGQRSDFSPPMNLSSEDEENTSLTSWFSKDQGNYPDLTKHAMQGYFPSDTAYYGSNIVSFSGVNRVLLTPSKNRKLVFERVPGAKDGQTKLSFA